MVLAVVQGDLFVVLLKLLDDLFIKFSLMIWRIRFLMLLLVAASITDTPEAAL